MSTRLTEDVLNDIIRYNHKGKSVVNEQLQLWIEHPKVEKEKVGDYFIMKFEDYLAVREDCSVYKSFLTKDEAMDYCLDKINNESKQAKLF